MALAVAALLLVPAAAQAKEVRLPQPPIGSFTEPKGLAVDQGSGDIYAIDGRSEIQQVKVSATAGKFKLKLGAAETGNLEFNVEAGALEAALRTAFCPGKSCITVVGGPGDATGSEPYKILFVETLATTDVEQLVCLPGTTPLSGGSGCSVTTTTNGVNGSITRYQANGAPSDFSALGSNAIDGRGPGSDATPQGGLHFSSTARVAQVAVDESGGATNGDIYVTQFALADHLVDVFAASGEYKGPLSEYEETPGNPATLKPLSRVCGVAVDGSGNVYVADLLTGIHKYDPAGNPVTNADSVANFTTVALPCTLAAGAGPTAGSLFADRTNGELFKLDAGTGEVKYGGQPISTGNTTVTADPTSGHVLTATGSEVKEFDASGASSATQIGSVPAGSEVRGVAVKGSPGKGGTLYLSREGATHLDAYGPILTVPDVTTEAPTEVAASTATLNGTISAAGGPEAHCSFQYATEAAYLADKAIPGHDGFTGASSAACEPAGPFTGSTLNAVSAKATSLAHETKYRFRIVGENESTKSPADDPGATLAFETFGKPQVRGGSASEITTTSAEIEAEVNPAGLATSFAVQYVSEADFQQSGYSKAATVPEPAKGIGALAAFVPVSQGLTGLVPETAYRFRLAATNTDGTTFSPEGAFATFAVPTGLLDNRAYEMVTPAFKEGEPFALEPELHTGLGGTCKACTPGWNRERFPMQASASGDAVAYEGDPFWAGLAAGANQYVSRRGAGGWATTGLGTPSYRDEIGPGEGFKALSPDLTRAIIKQSSPALTPEAPEGFANLYLQDEGSEALTTLITSGPPNRAPGVNRPDSFRLDYAGANAGSEAAPAFTHVIFQANDSLTAAVAGIAPKAPEVEAGQRDLYEWSNGQLHLVNVLPGNGAAAPNAVIGSGLLLEAAGEAANFDFDHAISADGRRVFWSAVPSGQVYVREGGKETREVKDPGKFITATPSGSEVLLSDGCLYDLQAEACEDLTLDQSSVHRGGFEGMAGASESLSRVYFVDEKALSPGAEEGKPNLYLSEGGQASFIATLLASDDNGSGSGLLGAWRAGAANRLAQASADGRFLAFESRASLTNYDNKGEFEVFEYDALKGALACASCNPSGQAPLGDSNLALISGNSEFFPAPQSLPPQGQGRLFFESRDTLTPADENGHIQDVYEWEPKGVGGCQSSFDSGGCVSLISSSQSPRDSHFTAASASGDDVFFDTRSQLVPQDEGDLVDLYDARVGGGIPQALEAPCEGEACKGAATAAPARHSPATATLLAPGNEKPKPKGCAKGRVRKRGKCLRRPRHRGHPRAAKHKRGGSR